MMHLYISLVLKAFTRIIMFDLNWHKIAVDKNMNWMKLKRHKPCAHVSL